MVGVIENISHNTAIMYRSIIMHVQHSMAHTPAALADDVGGILGSGCL
jgi:hypothetical protein